MDFVIDRLICYLLINITLIIIKMIMNLIFSYFSFEELTLLFVIYIIIYFKNVVYIFFLK